tara:strand:- start:12446 stop:12691 length:246 start_codon:yes stop_codon:yes gene_type:complete
MDNKYDKYVDELIKLENEYHETSKIFDLIEKKIKQLRADKDSASVKLHELREIEKTLINKIENETGEKISNDTLYAIINSK